MKKARPEPSLRAQWIGDNMKDLRKRRRIPQSDAAKHIQRNPTMLGRYENGEIPFRREDILALLDYYGVSSERERTNLLQLCDDIWRKDWWDAHRDDLGTEFINVPWLESRVNHINSYQHFFLPGLLQTRDYAETLIRKNSPRDSSEDLIERWIEIRLGRQRILTTDDHAQLTAVLEQSVLERPVGNDSMMQAQIEHLHAMNQQDNVEVLIIPTGHGPHLGHHGSFELYEMPSPYPDVAYLETLGGSLYLEEPAVKSVRNVWSDVHAMASPLEKFVPLDKKKREASK